ncbi:MAG: Asp-tRNA(Asn)/Glu-tRNA(Gln) amidotransferase subunit GatC [Myxococcota bacterium]|nr:Asp-tRNA(Asn)/Glu-tRNA(Gln) amidotransferase subunit GatC [Myxococcota bacterium]
MPDITSDDVHRLAELARLTVDSARVETLAAELSDITEYVQVLQSVTCTVTPSPHAMSSVRKDEVNPSLDREELLNAAPHSDADGFIVPRVVG